MTREAEAFLCIEGRIVDSKVVHGILLVLDHRGWDNLTTHSKVLGDKLEFASRTSYL